MNVNLSIDTSLTIGHYVFEASFKLKNWQLNTENYLNGAIVMLHIGPIFLCFTDLQKIKKAYSNKTKSNSLDSE